MKDSAIKGTGNSRYLKSSLEGITTWEQFRAALAAGTLPVDLNGINPEGFQQLGAPLNKVTFLKDGTAEKYGMDNTAVPDDVLDLLSKSVVTGTYPVVDFYAGQKWERGTAPSNTGSKNVWGTVSVVNNIAFSFPVEGPIAVMSTDGKKWETLTVPTIQGEYSHHGVRRIVYVNDTYYFLIPNRPAPYKATIYTSKDLSSWTLKCAVPVDGVVNSLFYSDFLSKFILIDERGNVYLSDDAERWQNLYNLGINGSPNTFNAGYDGPDGFYIAAFTGDICVFKLTADGFEKFFAAKNVTHEGDVSFIKFKGKYFVYTNAGVAVSKDLKNWQMHDATYSQAAIACSQNCVLGVANPDAYVSLDGINFKRFEDVFRGNGIACVNGVFVSIVQNPVDRINPLYSPDTKFRDEPGLLDVLGNIVPVPLKQIAGATAIETGTYRGTGESISIFLSKIPTIVFVFPVAEMRYNFDGGLCILFPAKKKMAFYGGQRDNSKNLLFGVADLTISVGDKCRLSWAKPEYENAGALCNVATEYAYVAFCTEEG